MEDFVNQPSAPPSPAEAPPQSSFAAAAGAATGEQPNGGAGGQFDPNTPSISQAHMNHLLAEQKRELKARYQDYDYLREKAEKFDTLVGTTKSIEEQAADLNTRLATTERDKGDLQLVIQRQKLAALAGIHPDLWDMIGGADEDSIKTNIDRLKQHVAPPAPENNGAEKQQQRRGRAPGQGRPGAGGGDAGPNGSIAAGRDLFESRQPKTGK